MYTGVVSENTGVIYAAWTGDGRWLKIGFTATPNTRLSMLSIYAKKWFSAPITKILIKDAGRDEELVFKRRLEAALGIPPGWRHSSRIRSSEWFEYSEALARFIESEGFRVYEAGPRYKDKPAPKWREHIKDMRQMRANGATLQQVANKYGGLSRERVRQILESTGGDVDGTGRERSGSDDSFYLT